MSCGVFKFFIRPCPMIIPMGHQGIVSVSTITHQSTGVHVTKRLFVINALQWGTKYKTQTDWFKRFEGFDRTIIRQLVRVHLLPSASSGATGNFPRAAQNCTGLQQWHILHHFTPFTPFYTILHHFAPVYTILHYNSPFCTILHHFAPVYSSDTNSTLPPGSKSPHTSDILDAELFVRNLSMFVSTTNEASLQRNKLHLTMDWFAIKLGDPSGWFMSLSGLEWGKVQPHFCWPRFCTSAPAAFAAGIALHKHLYLQVLHLYLQLEVLHWRIARMPALPWSSTWVCQICCWYATPRIRRICCISVCY